ncbi:hypothetical protein F4805DRAFT_22845 [Annulohypoxylon moriforme]|nr:hypothetical protein F4805DRAFT_22845 [Annulohypoxylon moriforme]
MPLKREILSEDLYAKLGVTRDASRDEIRIKYKELAKKWHPDKAGDTEQNKAEFRAIQEAWEVLGDEAGRKEYDGSRSKKVKLEDFIRGTYPEDPFKEKERAESSSPTSKKPKKEEEDDKPKPMYVYPDFLSGTYMTEGMTHLRKKLAEIERESEVAHVKFYACEREIHEVFVKREPDPEHIDWKISLQQARLGLGRFRSRLRTAKKMVPLGEQTHMGYYILMIVPGRLGKLSGAITTITLAVLTLAQLIEDYGQGRDNAREVQQQLTIIAFPEL